MQVTVSTRTSRRLVLRLKPVKLAAYWGIGFLFIALGVGAGWLLGRAASLVCARDVGGGGTCNWARSVGLRTRRETFAVSALRGAEVRLHSGGALQVMGLVVLSARGDLPLDLSNATGQVKDSLAGAITAFAQNPSAPTLRVHEDNRLLGLLLGLFLAGAGAACIYVIESAVLDLNRDRNLARIVGLRHGRLRRVSVPLDRVRGAGKEPFTVRHARSWSVHLKLGGGAREPLTRAALFTDASADQTVGLIRSWLEEAPK